MASSLLTAQSFISRWLAILLYTCTQVTTVVASPAAIREVPASSCQNLPGSCHPQAEALAPFLDRGHSLLQIKGQLAEKALHEQVAGTEAPTAKEEDGIIRIEINIGAAKEKVHALEKQLASATGASRDAIVKSLAAAKNQLGGLEDGLVTATLAVGHGISRGAHAVSHAAANSVRAAQQKVADLEKKIGSATGATKEALKKSLNAAQANLVSARDALSSAAITAVAGVVGAAEVIASGVVGGAFAVSNGVVSGVGAIGNGVVSGASAVGHGVVNGASATVNGVASGASAVGHGVASGASAVGHGVVAGAYGVGHGVASGASAVGHGVVNGAGATVNGVASGATYVGNAALDGGVVAAGLTVGVAEMTASGVDAGAHYVTQTAGDGVRAVGWPVYNGAGAVASGVGAVAAGVGGAVASLNPYAPLEHNDTVNATTTQECATVYNHGDWTAIDISLEKKWLHRIAQPGTRCVFGTDPRDEGKHCIYDNARFGANGWCWTSSDMNEFGSCNEHCPLQGHYAVLSDKLDVLVKDLEALDHKMPRAKASSLLADVNHREYSGSKGHHHRNGHGGEHHHHHRNKGPVENVQA